MLKHFIILSHTMFAWWEVWLALNRLKPMTWQSSTTSVRAEQLCLDCGAGWGKLLINLLFLLSSGPEYQVRMTYICVVPIAWTHALWYCLWWSHSRVRVTVAQWNVRLSIAPAESHSRLCASPCCRASPDLIQSCQSSLTSAASGLYCWWPSVVSP